MNYLKFFFILFYVVLMASCQEAKEKKPAENRFSLEVLLENLDEPMQFDILKDGKILFAERKGKIKLYDPAQQQVKVIADIPVSIGYYSEEGEELAPTGEDGLFGAVVDPNFDVNRWIYVFYSPMGGHHRSILSRFEWSGDSLNMQSEKLLLEIPNQRISCCHLGGGLLFDLNGNLLITTGDNTPNDPRGYTPIDERSGRDRFDAQRSSGNANDLRGKILRIHPEPDGTYSIPQDNLFPVGTPNTRPEIFTMGNRNPWRVSVDSKTGWVFWGEVGPAGIIDSVGFGPRSYDEFNVAKKPGNFGWPQFIGNNIPYWDYSYSTNTAVELFDPLYPVNKSPNNTGVENLPKAEPALIWYPQTISEGFPLMGSGSNSAVGGPIYRQGDFDNPARPFPPYYEGKWFITDWTRGWIMLVSIDREGNFVSMEEFLPDLKLNGPIDMKFGPEGDLYILEYGRGPYKLNQEARLSRIKFNAGNRSPNPNISVDKTAGAAPLTLSLSSEGTIDYDDDPLVLQWTISLDSQIVQVLHEPNPQVTLTATGNYLISLKVSDSKGGEAVARIDVTVGNDPPVVKWNLGSSNSSFYFPGDTIEYSVEVFDNEDGSLLGNSIQPERVSVNIEQVHLEEEGFEKDLSSLKEMGAMVSFQSVVAINIINSSDCRSCHSEKEKLIGPSYIQIADRYQNSMETKSYLMDKILKGGSGKWDSKLAMPPHPDLNNVQAEILTNYILGLKQEEKSQTYPTRGKIIIPSQRLEGEGGINDLLVKSTTRFIFRASYLDKGTESSKSLLGTASVILRNPLLPIISSDVYHDVEVNHQISVNRSSVIPKRAGAYVGFKNIDLTNIKGMKFDLNLLSNTSATDIGTIEIRIGSPDGDLRGELDINSKGRNRSLNTKAKIKDTIGYKDLYLVFAQSDQQDVSRIELRSVEFLK